MERALHCQGRDHPQVAPGRTRWAERARTPGCPWVRKHGVDLGDWTRSSQFGNASRRLHTAEVVCDCQRWTEHGCAHWRVAGSSTRCKHGARCGAEQHSAATTWPAS
jgi:hypothetical protein